jgi:catechol 2,3-dioxygenase
MILRQAHVEIGVDDLEAARTFYVDVLGFLEHERDSQHLYLRGVQEFDTWTLKITQADGPGLIHFALRVSSPEDLQELATLHENMGLPIERVAAGTEPGMGEMLRVLTPTGHPVEFVHQIDEIALYEAGHVRFPQRHMHRFHGVEPARLDHVNLRVPDMTQALTYWHEKLQFSISEMQLNEHDVPVIAWLRRRTGTHDVAFGIYQRPAFHHFAFYLLDPQAVIRAADILADAGFSASIERGPGRHGVTNALFLYINDPAGNRLELYFDDYVRDLDRPSILWRPGDALNWWGAAAPASFKNVTPVIQTAWIGAVTPAISPGE